MRKRLFEISAVLVGVAIVVFLYFGRGLPPEPATTPPAPTAAPDPVPIRPAPGPADAAAPRRDSTTPTVEAAAPMASEEALTEAVASWQSAQETVAAVEAELEVLDNRFDAKEEELAALEEQGLDPAQVEEEMLIFLDGIVDEYDALETQLAEAEAAEQAAAERIANLRSGADPF